MGKIVKNRCATAEELDIAKSKFDDMLNHRSDPQGKLYTFDDLLKIEIKDSVGDDMRNKQSDTL